MQKAKSVSRKIFVILMLMFFSSSFGQGKLEGDFYRNLIDYMYMFRFLQDGIFEHKEAGDMGISRYGRGHYTLTKDSLILNFDLTEPIENTYHRSVNYENYNDYIEIKVKVITANEAIPKLLEFHSLSDRVGATLDEKAEGIIKLKKEGKSKRITVSNIEYGVYEFDIFGAYNYDVVVYWKPITPYIDATAIKNARWAYKVIKNRKNYLELETPSKQRLIFRKKEPLE